MNYWLVLADPKSYSFNNLLHDRTTRWDGIAGSMAQKHLRSFSRGDEVLVYHTAPDKAVVGTAAVISDPYPDPADESGKRVVVDLQAASSLKTPVTLDQLRRTQSLSGMTFLKIQRIAVSPLTRAEYDDIVKLGS
jgi:predicted RNA-binding protein with PUA-like domain